MPVLQTFNSAHYMGKSAVFFYYFEATDVYKENLIFFLCLAYRKDIDFLIIVSVPCIVDLLDLVNFKYIYKEIKRNGWNICCLLEKYNSLDYRKPHRDINCSSLNGDPLYEGAYFGGTAQLSELVFIKTNRNLVSRRKLCWSTFCELQSSGNS